MKKKKILKTLLALAIIGALFAGGVAVNAQYTELQEEKTELDKHLKTVKAEKEAIEKELEKTATTLTETDKAKKAKEDEVKKKEAELKKKNEQVSSLEGKVSELEQELAFKIAAREEAERQAAEQAKASQTKVAQTASAPAQASYTSSGGGLTASAGVYNGPSGKETYYSQKVLPGGGLNIPGRHVAGDGTIRDADGYIVIASDNLPKGATAETSLGTGKVYDTGVGHPGVDIYTNW